MLLYHGTTLKFAYNIEKRGILLEKCKEYTDFGRGFYTSKTRQFAVDTAINRCKKFNLVNKSNIAIPAVVSFEFDEESLKDLKNYDFTKYNLEWLQFIVNNRNGIGYTNDIKDGFHNIDGSYDIVQGGIADGIIVEYADVCRVRKSKVSTVFLNQILYDDKEKAHQTSFHTKEALKSLKFVKIEEVSL